MLSHSLHDCAHVNWDLRSWYNGQSAWLDVTVACTNAKYSFLRKKKRRQKSLLMELLMQQMIGFEPKFKTEIFN